MDLFLSLINKVDELVADVPRVAYSFNSSKSWNDVGFSQVILQRDTAFELNGTGFSLVTTKEFDDEIIVVGNELSEIQGNSSFARVAIVQIDAIEDAQALHDIIKKIEYVKYNCYPQGFMMRSSSSTYKESVRVSKKGLTSGICFEKIGNLLINKIEEIPQVKAVKLYFITSEEADYSQISDIAQKNREITQTLNRVMNEALVDCDSCKLKSVCDEVEGMRELHFKSIKGD